MLAGRALGSVHHGRGRADRVSVEHTRLTLTFTGAEHGTNPTDFWIVPEHRPHRA